MILGSHLDKTEPFNLSEQLLHNGVLQRSATLIRRVIGTKATDREDNTDSSPYAKHKVLRPI